MDHFVVAPLRLCEQGGRSVIDIAKISQSKNALLPILHGQEYEGMADIQGLEGIHECLHDGQVWSDLASSLTELE